MTAEVYFMTKFSVSLLAALSRSGQIGIVCALGGVLIVIVAAIIIATLLHHHKGAKVVSGNLKERPIFITDSYGELTDIVRHVNKRTGMAEIVKLNKSYQARFIQSFDQTKVRYTQLKNEILSYAHTSSKIDWSCETFFVRKKVMAKVDIVDGVIYLYLPIDASKYEGTHIFLERVKDRDGGEISSRYCIKDDVDMVIAVDLLADLGKRFSVAKLSRVGVDYFQPYEKCEVLVDRGLITEYVKKVNYADFLNEKGLTETFKQPNGEFLCPEKFEFIDCKKV
jgi:hypothetical protein